MFLLLCVSSIAASADGAEPDVAKMLQEWTALNEAAGITGALLHTSNHVSQIMEGPEAVVRARMDDMRRDTRMSAMTVITESQQEFRRFESWAPAYSCCSTFADDVVRQVLVQRDDPSGYAVRRLIRLMQEVVRSAQKG